MNMQISSDIRWGSEYCRKYWPEECAHILRIARDAVEARFLFDLPWDMEQTVRPVEFQGEPDWEYMPDGDPEFIYQFNRHRYWICLGQAYALTGEEGFAQCFGAHLTSWLRNNPLTEPAGKTVWRTIEAGIRGENWVKAMEYFKDSPSVTAEIRGAFEQGLRLHGEYLMNCRLPFSDKSNWGVLESHGLFDIGAALGDQSYITEALGRLERELAVQVMDDGVHWEQSPMYHNEVLRCVLEVIRMGEARGIRLPAALYEKARAMAYADIAWVKPDHTQPLNGDSDRTDLRDVFTPAALLLKDSFLRYMGYERLDFESAWEFGEEAALEYRSMKASAPDGQFYALEHSGNWFLRSGWGENGDYLHFKCGSLGGGHGHFDKLHLDLCINGEDILIDSGRYTYVDGRLRRQLKSSCAHNVPVVDWRDYTQCTDSWGVTGAAPATGQQWRRKGPFTFLQGTHLGYMPEGVLANRRILSIGTRIHVVADGFYGSQCHICSQLFHLNPEGAARLSEGGFCYTGKNGAADFTVITPGAVVEMEDAPLSFHYNRLESAPCVSVWKEGPLFLSLITVITGYETGGENPYTVEKLPVTVPVTGRCLEDREGEAVRIRGEGHSWIVVMNHGETSADCEYTGANGRFGLGRVMVCDEWDPSGPMTVLQW